MAFSFPTCLGGWECGGGCCFSLCGTGQATSAVTFVCYQLSRILGVTTLLKQLCACVRVSDCACRGRTCSYEAQGSGRTKCSVPLILS